MERISKEISKKVISIGSGNIVGYVLNVLFDEELKHIEGYMVVDDESEEVFLLSCQKIKSKSEECFMMDNDDDLEIYISSVFNNPIGKVVYDKNGLNLGKVIDIEHERYCVKKIITTKCEFPSIYLQKAGNDCLIFGKNKKKKPKVLFKSKANLPKVYIEEKQVVQKTKEYPIRLIAQSENLLGKRISHDIFGLNNELIARENEVVTKAIIQKAKKHNRYNLLMFYVR